MQIKYIGIMNKSEAKAKGYLDSQSYEIHPAEPKLYQGKLIEQVEVIKLLDEFKNQAIDSPTKAKQWNGFFKKGGWKRLLTDL